MDWQTEALPSVPDPEPELSASPQSIAEIVALAGDLSGSYWDRERIGEQPCEDEMIAHYAVPLLRAARLAA
jgi:hypothetical protein